MTQARTLFVLFLVVLLGGCALAEQQRVDRALRDSQLDRQFVAERNRCFTLGGKMVIDAHQTVHRDGLPHRGDRYLCVLH